MRQIYILTYFATTQPCTSGLPVQIWTYAPPPFPEAVDVGPSWMQNFAGLHPRHSHELAVLQPFGKNVAHLPRCPSRTTKCIKN